MSLACPKCGGDTYVIDSRPQEENKLIWRHRKCSMCEYRFTTEERVRNTEPGSVEAKAMAIKALEKQEI